MNSTKYQAKIYFQAEEDTYNEGLNGSMGANWIEILEARTKEELTGLIEYQVYKKRADWDDEQMNAYDWATEYHASYLTNENNEGEASPNEVEAWEKGECRLWLVDCHILVSKVVTDETKTNL